MTRSARQRWILRGAVMCAAVLLLLTPAALTAKQGVVKTREGRTIEGDVDERADSVVITVRGIATTVARENVDSIEYRGSVEDQYKDRLAKLQQPGSAADHLELARWLLDNKAYSLAMKEVSAAERIDPNSADAATLQQTIEGQMRLDRSTHGTNSTPRIPITGPLPGNRTGATTTMAGSGYTAAMHKYITADDINSIRQMEWPSDDNTVKVTFVNDVKRRFISRMQINTVQFNGMSQAEQAKQILTDGTAEERKDVRLLTDPIPIAEYKRGIQSTILTNCATAGCHGGPAGGKFFLYSNPESDAATYTNFYLLTQTVAGSGGAQHLLIDRAYPQQSLLALWGLPPEISKVSHPPVQGVAWRPIYKSAEDPQYKVMIKWINKLVPMNIGGSGAPVPQYGFPSPLPPLAGSDSAPPQGTTPPLKPRAATRPARTR